MISTSDFRKGLRLLIDGEPYTLADIQVQMPAARGANTLVKIRARHVLTRQVIDRTLKAGERFEHTTRSLQVGQARRHVRQQAFFAGGRQPR